MERQVSVAITVLQDEETERLKNIRRVLKENRPMEGDRDSFVGLTKAFLVGIFRASQLLFRVLDRVNYLMESEKLDDKDDKILKT